MFRSLFTVFLLFVATSVWAQAPTNFRHAKVLSQRHVYFDQAQSGLGSLYCGCSWKWVGESGGRMDHQSCGYIPRSRGQRADRLEWEHIVPASWIGQQRQCWQNGGRSNCQKTDPQFSAMEADMHNLYPTVGEVNADRSNYALFVLPTSHPRVYGQCQTTVDFKQRVMDPRPQARGLIARVHFYMADRYGMRLSSQQQRVLIAWANHYPPTPWEIERDRRISQWMGVSNPFVTGHKTWTERGVIVNSAIPVSAPPPPPPMPQRAPAPDLGNSPPIYGNKSSGIYHIRGLCPGYEKISSRNRVAFESEQQAVASGFRRAGNCNN